MIDENTAVFWNRSIKRRTAKWAYGLMSGFIGAFSGTVKSTLALMIVDPVNFNLQHTAKTLGVASAIGILNGIDVACAFLMKSPLPGPTDTEIISKQEIEKTKTQ